MAGSAVLSSARMSPLCSGRTLEEGFSEVLRNPQMPVSTLLRANKGTPQAGRLRRDMGYQNQSSGHPWLQGTLSFLSPSFPAHSLSITSSIHRSLLPLWVFPRICFLHCSICNSTPLEKSLFPLVPWKTTSWFKASFLRSRPHFQGPGGHDYLKKHDQKQFIIFPPEHLSLKPSCFCQRDHQSTLQTGTPLRPVNSYLMLMSSEMPGWSALSQPVFCVAASSTTSCHRCLVG